MIYLVTAVAIAATVAVWGVLRKWSAVTWGPDRRWVMFLNPEKRNGIALLLLRGVREVLVPFTGAALFFSILQALADLRVAGVGDETTYRAIEEHIRTVRFVAVAPIKPSPLFALMVVIATSLLGMVMPSLRFFTSSLRRAGAVISRMYTILTFFAAFTFFGGAYNGHVDDLVVRLNRDLDEIRTAYREYRTHTAAVAVQLVADTAVRTGAAAPEEERVRATLVDVNLAHTDLQRAEVRLAVLRKHGVPISDHVSRAREAIEQATVARQMRRADVRVTSDTDPQPHWSKRAAAQHDERLRRAVHFATAPTMRDVLQTAAEGAFEKVAASIIRFVLGTGGPADVLGEIISPDALKIGDLSSRLGEFIFRRTAIDGIAETAAVAESTADVTRVLHAQRRRVPPQSRAKARADAASVIAESDRVVDRQMSLMLTSEKDALERQWHASFGCKSDEALASASETLRRKLLEKLEAISEPAERLTSYRTANQKIKAEGTADPNSAQALRNVEVSQVGPHSNIVNSKLLAKPRQSGTTSLMAAISDPTMTYEKLMKLKG